MNNFIYLELKKILSKNTLIIGILFLTLTLIPMFLNAQVDVLDGQGNIHSGINGWKILKKRSTPVEGIMTTEYLIKMREYYQSSVDKDFIESKIDTEKKLGKRLVFPQDQLHWLLNFPYNKVNSLYNDFSLSNEQIKNFYINWKTSFPDYLKNEINQFNYTDTQIKLIEQKAKKVDTPFVNKYNMGWQYLKINLWDTLYIFFIFLAFILSNEFSKNHKKGIDQIILSTKESRKKFVNYKIRSASIFATFAYLIYVGIMLLFIWRIYSFHGWDSLIQLGNRTCIYSLNCLQEGIIYIVMGYLATIVITHLILFLSIVLKQGKIVLLLLIFYFYRINSYKMATSKIIKKINLFMPQNFVNNLFTTNNLFFVGNKVVPYVFVACLIGLIYIIFFRMMIKIFMKKYYLQ